MDSPRRSMMQLLFAVGSLIRARISAWSRWWQGRKRQEDRRPGRTTVEWTTKPQYTRGYDRRDRPPTKAPYNFALVKARRRMARESRRRNRTA